MIAEVIDVEIKVSHVTNREYLAIHTLCEGELKFLYLGIEATEMGRVLCAFADVVYDDYAIVDVFQFKGKLIPVNYATVHYANRHFSNVLQYNIIGIKTCLSSYHSPIEEVEQEDDGYIE